MDLNTQPIERPIDNPNQIQVIRIWETIQGEGPFAGTPAVFIRLAGCNLQCPMCDTQYTQNRMFLSPQEICQQVLNIRSHLNLDSRNTLVVLTGGEPFRQNIYKLVDELLLHQFRVQVETNGTYYSPQTSLGLITVVCSPKTPEINPFMKKYIAALKYVVTAGATDPNDGLPLTTLGTKHGIAKPWEGFKGEIYIQPADEGEVGDQCDNCNRQFTNHRNEKNLEEAIRVCMKFGYRLCLQTHKIIGLD